MDVRATIISTVKEVAARQDVELAPLSDELPLLDTGLDSLCIAIIVARLEDELDVDPFSNDEDFAFPVTFGEFVGLYEDAVAGATS